VALAHYSRGSSSGRGEVLSGRGGHPSPAAGGEAAPRAVERS
jgi:hypothetical protein